MNPSPTYTLKTIAPTRTIRRKRAATALLFLLTALAVNATPITVPNASFESPTSPAQSSTNFNLLPGWVFNVKSGSEFGTMAISSHFTSPGASAGNNCAFINNDVANMTDTITSASSLATITPLTDYTLTLAIGNVKGSDSSLYGAPGPVSFSLLANGAVIATQEVPNGTVPNGTFEDFSLTYDSPSSGPVIGDNLTIQLATLPQQGSAYEAAFDNVTLSDASFDPPSAVAEPPTWALTLIVLGALVLCLIRRRQIR